MRRLMMATVVGLCLTATSGCILPIYSGDPGTRTQQLIFTSETCVTCWKKAADLVLGPAQPSVAVSYTWRPDLTSLLVLRGARWALHGARWALGAAAAT